MKSNLVKRGFLALIATQFFGAANDNILKGVLIFMLVDGTWRGQMGAGGQGYANVLFTLPFILLSGYAGRFADRNSKRFVTVLVKFLEIPIALIALVGFLVGSLWITLLALVALACQSAYFGPAKYGMIPELVENRDLSRANGTINMMTNLAVIIGTLASGKIADLYNPLPQGNAPVAEPQLWLPGIVMACLAIVGLCSALLLPRLRSGDKSIRYERNPFGTYISAIKAMWGTSLLIVMFAWAYFYFLAGLALLMIPEYTVVLEKYQVTRSEISWLLGVMGVAIGIGSVFAGIISGHAIRPRLIPVGAIGLTVFFALLGLIPPTLPDMPPYTRILFSPIAICIFGAGVSAGFYIIPLQAMLQRLTPPNELGRFLGTANGVSFTFLLLSSLFYPLIRPMFTTPGGAEHPEKIFLVASVLMIAGLIFFVWRARVRGFSFDRFE